MFRLTKHVMLYLMVFNEQSIRHVTKTLHDTQIIFCVYSVLETEVIYF